MVSKQAIIIRTDLRMSRGKIAAQSAHASVLAMEKVTTAGYNAWVGSGMKKVVLRIKGKKKMLDLYNKAKRKFPASLVKDAGLTQVKPGEPTCIAIGPANDVDLDRLTSKLKLL